MKENLYVNNDYHLLMNFRPTVLYGVIEKKKRVKLIFNYEMKSMDSRRKRFSFQQENTTKLREQ